MDWKRYLRQLVSCLIPAAAAVFLWSCNEAEPQNDAGFRQISCEKELFRLTRRTLKKETVRLDFMIPEKKMRFTAAPAGSPAALWNDYLQFGKNVYDPNEYNRCIGRFTAEPETFYSDLTFRTWKKRCETEYQILSGHSIAWILKIPGGDGLYAVCTQPEEILVQNKIPILQNGRRLYVRQHRGSWQIVADEPSAGKAFFKRWQQHLDCGGEDHFRREYRKIH